MKSRGLRWKMRVFIAFGLLGAIVVIAALVSLFFVNIEDTVYADGKIIPEHTYDIVGHVDGRLVELLREEGDDVAQGELIARIDSVQYEEEMLATQNALKELEAELEVRKADLAALEKDPLPKELWHSKTDLAENEKKAAIAKDKMERYKKLYDLGAISRQDLDAAIKENVAAGADLDRAKDNIDKVMDGLASKSIDKAKRAVDLAQAKVDGKKAALALCMKHIAECKILSPEAGRIVELPCKHTMFVEKGKVAIKMATGITLKGLAMVDESVVRKIRVGQEVRISSGVYSKLLYGHFSGRVDRVRDNPDASGTLRKYPVEIIVDSQGCELKLGSSAEFAIVTGRQSAILTFLGVPNEDERNAPPKNKVAKLFLPASKGNAN